MKRQIFILCLLLLPLSSQAFELGDHKTIMIQASQEFDACFPGVLSSMDHTLLWQSDLDEDLNVFRKDLLYSHFYNPFKKLKMLRFDSSVRVSDLRSDLEAPLDGDAWDARERMVLLGQMVHHLQDAATPPHVVPVMHGPDDGFERYPFKGDISSGLSCADLAKIETPDSLLKSTAIETLANLRAIHLTVGTLEITGESFWKDSGNNDFGSYGSLGNRFGDTQLGPNQNVPASFYDRVKQAQMKLAVRASLKGLTWYYRTAK